MNATQFWMVKGSGPAYYEHPSLSGAEAEAERLARLHPGQTFTVLEAVSACRRVDVERVSFRDENDQQLPF